MRAGPDEQRIVAVRADRLVVMVETVGELFVVRGSPGRHGRMGDEQQSTAGSHMPGGLGQQLLPSIGQPGVEETPDDEVEAASASVIDGRLPGGDVGDGEVRGDSAILGRLPSAVDGRGREVDAGGVPAVFGHPDDVGALTAADVEDSARFEAGHRVDEGCVGVAGPDRVLGSGVALLPGGDGVGDSGIGRLLVCAHLSVPGSSAAGIPSGAVLAEAASASTPSSCLASSARTSSMSRPLTAVMTCSSWGAARAPG